MEIVTGSTGQVHVTSIDDAVRNGNPGYLNKRVVLTFLENFAYTIVNNNQVKIGSGYGMNQGRVFKIDEGEFDMVTIESGSQGYKRSDIIAARYTMNTQSGFENISLVAIRGTSGTTYTDPSYTVGNINQGATLDDMPLYRVKINGLVIESVERMFTLVRDGARLGELEKKVNDHMTYFNKINVRTNLASEGAPLLKDGGETGDIRPGVQGTLPASHGGTGQTTLKNAGNSILNSLDENNTNPTNDTYFIGSTTGVSGFQKKKISSIWNYILGKIRTQLGLTNDVVPISHGGTGKTSVGNSKILVGSNGAFVEKTLSTTLAEASNDKIPTTKAVADELETRGYGDMTKATFCNANTTTIAVAHGGTGATTAKASATALIDGLDANNTNPADSTVFIGSTPSVTGYQKKTMISLWNYVLTKIRNQMELMTVGSTTDVVPIKHGGTGKTTAADARTNLGVPPTNHASSATTYGIGTSSNFGHLKISDSSSENNTAAAGIAASGKALHNIYLQLERDIRDTASGLNDAISQIASNVPPKNHASSATTYGVGTTSNYGHLKISDSPTTSQTAASGIAASGKALKVAYDDIIDRLGAMLNDFRTLSSSVPPKNHASSATTYGIGTTSNYGHLKISDSPSNSQTAASGIAASGKALRGAYDDLLNRVNSVFNDLGTITQLLMPKAGGTFTGNVYFNNLAQVFGDRLILGTTASRGKLRIYSSNSTAHYGDLTESAVTLNGNYTYSIPNSSGTIQVTKPSSRRIKENIHDMTEERAKKLLDLDIVNFDYIGEFGGGEKDQSGVIAEDAVKVIPEAVIIPEKYDESKPVDDEKNPAPSVDYRQYIPYLIKMVQMQQKEIEELKAALNK